MTVLLTLLTMLAFAANSLLARAALAGAAIDPVSFTLLRLVSGAAMLAVVMLWRRGWQGLAARPGNWISALCLLGYGIGFSLAYLRLTAATGALILFAAVQASMMLLAALQGHHPRRGELLGLAIALAGFVWLMLPGLHTPDRLGAVLMAGAGAAWGGYSMRGRGGRDPVAESAGNFLRAALLCAGMAAPVLLVAAPAIHDDGAALAVLSGAVTSGLGYVLWYRVLTRLTPIASASVQLTVPVIAAFGGVIVLGEAMTQRLVLAALVILTGVGLTAIMRAR